MEINYHHNIAVIGAGPAGATASIILAQAGFDVCLIEKKSFPRDVLCGEFLSREVISILEQLNLFDRFAALNPVEIKRFKAISKKGSEISAEIEFPSYAMKRSVFDNFLMDCSKETGVIVYQPAEVKSIKKDDRGYILDVKDSQKDFGIVANIVIAAYGRQNNIDEKLSRKFAGKQTGLNGIKFHIPNEYLNELPGNEIRIYSGDGIYCGLNKISDDETTLCFLESRKNSNNSSKQKLSEFYYSNKKFKELFNKDIVQIVSGLQVYGTGNIYFGKRNVVENGIFMIGDAAGVIAPLTGDGIGMALQSAWLIASLLKELKNDGIKSEQLIKTYTMQWERLFSRRMRLALFIQNRIMNNPPAELFIKTAKLFPFLLPQIINATRGK